jgi:hypothetical protein
VTIEETPMHHIVSATMRITLATLMLLGVCLFVLLGLLRFICELFADEQARASALTEDDSQPRDALAAQVSLQLERR